MIIDSVKSFERYLNLHERFAQVHEFLKANDLTKLEEGKHVIDPNNIWCTITKTEGKGLDNPTPLEAHDSFIDIHIVLDGGELIGFKDRARCDCTDVKYDEANDVALIPDEDPEVYVSNFGGNFVMCFPQDCHSPLMGEGPLTKAVIKVRV